MRGKKLRGNGLWESSRFMIPEHTQAFREHQVEKRKHPKPELDNDEIERIAAVIQEAIDTNSDITLLVYDPFEDKIVSGKIHYADPHIKRFRVGEEYVWFKDVLKAWVD